MAAELPSISDDILLERIRRGDSESLDLLFRRHRSVAYRVAYRLLGHEDDCLDAVQEGFKNALANLDRFRGGSTFKTWLLRIVSNAALDLGRRKQRQAAYFAGSTEAIQEEEAIPGNEPPPDAAAERADLRQRLSEALACLPEIQRQTFVLHVDGELSYQEVADTLGISIGTVMSRIFYARKRLQSLLADYVTS